MHLTPVALQVVTTYGGSGALKSRSLWMLLMLAVAAPLSFLRDISALAYASCASFLCTLYITVMYAPATFDPCDGPSAASVPLDLVEMGTGPLPTYCKVVHRCHQ